MPEIIYDYQFDGFMYLEGQKFYQAALTLKEHPPHYTNTPYWALLAFSVELLLKSLHVKTVIDYPGKLYDPENPAAHNPSVVVPQENIKHKHPKGHKLHKVFGKLPENMQGNLKRMATEQYGLDIEKVLEEHEDLFVNARYIYPLENYDVNEADLESIAELLASTGKKNTNEP